MLKKNFLIRIAQYRVENAPVVPWIGHPSHYAIQLVNPRGVVIDEINFGSRRRGTQILDFAGRPWHNNKLSYQRRIVDRDALNHPAERRFTECMARGMFDALELYARDIDDADLDYYFMGSHWFKQRTSNSNSAAMGALRIMGHETDWVAVSKDFNPVGWDKDIFQTIPTYLGSPQHYRRLACREAHRVYRAKTRHDPVTDLLQDTPFRGWSFRFYLSKMALRRWLIKFYDRLFGR